MSTCFSEQKPLRVFWKSLFGRPERPGDAPSGLGGSRVLTGSLLYTSLTINLLGLALPITALQVYDRILPNASMSTLYVLVAGVVVAALCEATLRFCRNYVTAWSGTVYEHSASCGIIEQVLNSDIRRMEAIGGGEHLQRMAAIRRMRDFYSGQTATTLIDLPFVAVFIGLIAYLAGPLAYVTLLSLGAFALFAVGLGARLRRCLTEQEVSDDVRYNFIIETLKGVHTVKAFGLEDVFLRRYERLQHSSSLAQYQTALTSSQAHNDGIIFSYFLIVGTMAFGAPMAMANEITMGTLIACMMLSGRMTQPIQRLFGLWVRFQEFQLAAAKIQEFRSTDTGAGQQRAGNDAPNDGRLDMGDVAFAYGETSAPILKSVSLRLERGDCIAITGASGSGKSTLLRIIAGIYRPDAGQVLVNGIEASSMSSDALLRQVAYMPADGAIFQGSIAENLSRFGRVPDAHVRAMTDLLGLTREVSALPQGFDTVMDGSIGDHVPDGLRQRIALARVLALKPRLLLFDNADKWFDRESYNHVYRLLGRLKGKVTMIIVSNDWNLLDLADKIYALEDGKLRETDDAQEHKLYEAQPYRQLQI